MRDVINQHFVPQSYLKRFNNMRDRIHVFDKVKKATFETDVRNVASGRYFYDIPPNLAKDPSHIQLVERTFSKYESKYSRLISDVLTRVERNSRLPIRSWRHAMTKEEKHQLSYLFALQIVRTREFRAQYVELYKKSIKAMLQAKVTAKGLNISPEEYSIQMDPDHVPIEHAKLIFKPGIVPELAYHLKRHVWAIGINQTHQPFYTSDHPIVKRGHVKHPVLSLGGYASPGIEVALPLTPTCILIMFDRVIFKELRRRDRKLGLLTFNNVIYYNSLQLFESYRQIYSSEPRFDLARRICDDHPRICLEDRERVSVSGPGFSSETFYEHGQQPDKA